MQSIPDISVIIPVYNVEKYIEQCLGSVVNQTLKNIEIIIIIDGSTDNSENIARNFAEKYSNITIVKTENRGLGAARNEGIKHAKGKYLSFIDSDDWIDLEMFEKMYSSALEHNADIVACNFVFEYETGTKEVQPDMISKLITDKDEAIKDVLLSQNMNNCAWNKIYKHSLFTGNTIRFTEGRYFEDLYPMLQWISLCDVIYLTDKPYYHYRRSRNGSITAKFSQKHIDDYSFLIDNVKNLLTKNNRIDQFRKEFSTCAFRIYNQLVFNVFFSNITDRYTFYQEVISKFLEKNYFTSDQVNNSEKNKFLLITLLKTTNKGKTGKYISFWLMNVFCSILKRLR